MEVLKINKSSDEFVQRVREPPEDEIAVLGMIDTDNNTMEFLFPNAQSMSRVVGVGLEYSTVSLNAKLHVSVFGRGRLEWLEAQTRALDDSSDYIGMVFKFPLHEQPGQTQGELLTGQEASRKFGVGLAGTHVYYSYAGGGEKVVARCPLLWELAVILLQQKFEEEEHHVRAATESGAETERKDSAAGEMGEGATGRNQWSELLKIYYRNGKPVCGAPRGKFRKIEQRVAVHPQPDGSFTNMKQESIDPPLDLVDAQISSQLVFNFVYNSDEMGNERKIEVTNRTMCDLGEHGFKVDERDRFGWFQDDIRISFRCKDQDSNPSRLREYAFSEGGVEQRLAETSSVDDDDDEDDEELRADTNILHELEHSQGFAEGHLISRIMEEERSSGKTAVMEKTFKMLGKQNLGGFCILNHSCASTVTYTLMFKTTLPDSIWKTSVRKSLINCGPCLAVWGKVTGSWELLNEEESAPYHLKVERRLQEKLNKVLPEDERTYQNDIFARNIVRQTYKVPLFVNHVMSHFLVR
ncbi:unnamed protein product [Sphagnum jensenii]|uniref:Uncharacterized protein n=1 Tax=Sphagnum jensenii TaxID=128206 RepID=A0ABP1B8B9_9BRYO